MLESKSFTIPARAALPTTVDNVAAGQVAARLDTSDAAETASLEVGLTH